MISIPFHSLSIGRHTFDFDIDGTLFSDRGYEEINDARIHLHIDLDRSERMMQLQCHLEGHLDVACDRCLDPISLRVDHSEPLIIRFAEQTRLGDDYWEFGTKESHIELDDWAYEVLVLLKPLSVFHPEGTCNPDMLKYLSARPDQIVESSEEDPIDPRWAVLKSLKI